MYAVFLDRAAIELIKVLTGCTNVDIEYVNVGVGIFVANKHRVLCGIHTAYLRAIFLALFGASRAT